MDAGERGHGPWDQLIEAMKCSSKNGTSSRKTSLEEGGHAFDLRFNQADVPLRARRFNQLQLNRTCYLHHCSKFMRAASGRRDGGSDQASTGSSSPYILMAKASAWAMSFTSSSCGERSSPTFAKNTSMYQHKVLPNCTVSPT